MYSVLFICTANICRSPMAMALLKARVVGQADLWQIASAGVWAMTGNEAAAFTQVVVAQRGQELRAHRSQPVSRELIGAYNLILTMERGHKEALRAAFPEYASRVYLVWEMADQMREVVDPIGRSLVDYEDTANEIEMIFDLGWERICQLAVDKEQ